MRNISIGFLLFLAGALSIVLAQDPPKKPWQHGTDLNLVATEGNSETRTLGLSHASQYDRETHHFKITFEHFESRYTEITRSAVLENGQIDVIETKTQIETDDSYDLDLQFEKDLSQDYFWKISGGWDRNEFKGIKNRYETSLGFGYRFFETERGGFKASLGALYVSEEQVAEPPGYDGEQLGYRIEYNFFHKFGANALFEQAFTGSGSGEDTGDYRLELKNGLSSTLTKRISLKLNLKLTYESEPALVLVPLQVGGQTVDQVPYELDSLDTHLNVAVSIKY